MMNFRRLGALCAVSALAGLAACDDNEINSPELPETGFVRVANTNFVIGENVDLYADGTRIAADIAPGEVSEFVELEIGTYDFAVTVANSPGDTIQADEITLAGGLNNDPIPVTYLVYDYDYRDATTPRDGIADFAVADPLVEVFRRVDGNEGLVRLHNLSPQLLQGIAIDLGNDDNINGGDLAELDNLPSGFNSEDYCPAGCAGGFVVPAGTSYPIALYRRSGARAGWTKRVFNVTVPAGEGWNAVLVGDWNTTAGANRLRLFVYDMEGNVQVVERAS